MDVPSMSPRSSWERIIVKRHIQQTLGGFFAAFLLAACATTGGSTGSAVDTACANLPAAHYGFLAYSAVKPVSASAAAKEATAYNVASAACAARTGDTLSKVNAALQIIAALQGA